MSRKSNIKWRKEDRSEITKLVRSFNSKITRVGKKDPSLAAYLPERLTVESLISKIETRTDFNREIKSYRRFLEKGSEQAIESEGGIKTTKWFKKEVSYKVAQINRNRTRERKAADVSTYKGTMGSIESNNLRKKPFNFETMRKKDWNYFLKSVDKQIMSNYNSDRILLYKKNYLNAIENNLFDYFNDDNNVGAQILYDYVKKIDAELMHKVYYDDPILQIQFISDPLDVDVIIEHTLRRWTKLMGDDYDEVAKTEERLIDQYRRDMQG